MKTSNIILLSFFALILLSITVGLFSLSCNIHFGKEEDQAMRTDSTGHPRSHSFHRGNGFFSATYNQEDNSTGDEVQMKLPHFNTIEIENRFYVHYTQGTPQKVVLKTTSDLLKQTEVTVNNQKLSLRCTETLRSKQHIDVYITTDSINTIDATAGCKFETTDKLKVHHFNVSGSAGTILKVDGDFNDFKLNLTAGCIGTFSGTSKDLYLQSSAGCVINANNLVAQRGRLECSTGSVVNVNVTGQLSVEASTGSLVNCQGNPTVKNKSISSGAQLHL